jgi:hypothetical protein
VGNGSTSIPGLLTSGHRLTQLNIRLLQQADFAALDDLDTGFQAESLLCWAKMAVRVNAAMINYRESVLAALQEEGHRVKAVGEGEETAENESPCPNLQLNDAITAVREQNYQAECKAIAYAQEISDDQYRITKRRLVKTVAERRALKQYDLRQRYGIPVTPQLVVLDDNGWHQKLRLHYFLTLGRPYLSDRDALIARKLLEQGQGNLFLPDFNGSQLGAIIGTLEILGIPILLADPKRELRNSDEDLQAMAAIALGNRKEIKTVVGIGIAHNASPITIIRRFLELMGYGLNCLRCEGNRQKRIRVYQVVVPNDGREIILQQWLAVDRKSPGSSENWQNENYPLLNFKQTSQDSPNRKYIQLSLDLD